MVREPDRLEIDISDEMIDAKAETLMREFPREWSFGTDGISYEMAKAIARDLLKESLAKHPSLEHVRL